LPLILIGLASCQEAHVSAPIVRALLAREHEVRIAWFGSAAEYEQAVALGLPDTDTVIAGDADGDSRALAAYEFFADEWLQCPIALSVGHGVAAVAIAELAHERGAKVLRIDAGNRTGDIRDRRRRLADHSADAWCVTSDSQKEQLLQEGFAADDITVVGSLTAQALAELPPPTPPAQPFVWLAMEHSQTREVHGEQLLAQCEAASEHCGLALKTASPEIGATEQLQAARSASVVITDSLGYQDLCAATGTPCIVVAPAGARWDLLVSGAVTVVDRASQLPEAVARAFERRGFGFEAMVAPDAAGSIAQVVERWLSPATAIEPSEDDTLPTEANASGRTFDDSELRFLDAAVRSGTLNSTRGTFVTRFESEFAEWLGCRHAIACASGSAAVHCAIAAMGLQSGDEVITTPITDMGALTPIFYEGAIPVFADVDPATLNVTAETIAAQLTDRTKAIIVTHLFGRPCEMTAILQLAKQHGLPVIEDAAQAFGATYQERAIGTFGSVAAFSLQQGKHITTGEGGIVCTDDDDIARRVNLFVNKAWGYGDPKPDHYFPALNYRLTELQGAVACAQLPKLHEVVAHRRMVAADLHQRLSNLRGIRCPEDPPQGKHSYWKFAFCVDSNIVPGGAVALGNRMRSAGIACAPRYVVKPAFECQVFRDWRNSPVTAQPLRNNVRGQRDGLLFDRANYPGSVVGLEQVVVLPINERYRPHHVHNVATAIQIAHEELIDG
jgi:perosamine synthetase